MAAVKRGVKNATEWLLRKNYANVIVETNNECDIRYHHEILKPHRVPELMELARSVAAKRHRASLLVGASFSGGKVPAFTPDPRAQPTNCLGGTGIPVAPSNVGEIDYFDPNTRYPQNLRAALGADERLPFWDLLGTVDLLYTTDVNEFYTNDENLTFTGYDGEGRATYGTLTSGTSSSGAPVLVSEFERDPARGAFRNWLFTVVRRKLVSRRRAERSRPQARGDPQALLLMERRAAPEAAAEWDTERKPSPFACARALARAAVTAVTRPASWGTAIDGPTSHQGRARPGHTKPEAASRSADTRTGENGAGAAGSGGSQWRVEPARAVGPPAFAARRQIPRVVPAGIVGERRRSLGGANAGPCARG